MIEKFGEAVVPLVEGFSGRVAVAFHSFQSAASYTLNATQAMGAASLIKLPLLVHALSEVARGRLDRCLRGLWHDAGLVYDAHGTPLYALAVMTEGSLDRSYSFEQGA